MAAHFNLKQLLVDAELTAANVYDLGQESAGAIRFHVFYGPETVDVWMPDVPLKAIRFLHGEQRPSGGRPLKVQIDGCAWTWPVAVDILSHHLLGRESASSEALQQLWDERRRRASEWQQIIAGLEDLAS